MNTYRLSMIAVVLAGCASRADTVAEPVTLDPPPSSESSAEPAASTPAPSVTAVAVNQVGYFPDRSKWATVVTSIVEAQEWTLIDAGKNIVAKGRTMPFGTDRSSGDTVQRLDFSSVEAQGDDFRLVVAGVESPPFAIRNDLYRGLKGDALHFFYHQRSGVPIEMPYAIDAQWARGAGHLGDAKVGCLPELECSFELDVKGGWYDAGDHGKYVVNGGISAWTLLNLYEVATGVQKRSSVFGDAGSPIPESGNGVDDLLDEARFELEFLMKMQVPASSKKWKGMAMHKVHDEAWTPLPTNPATSKAKRYLHAPSTAATLNLAAAAAAGARIWKAIDPNFSKACLKAARRAWVAAKANPEMFALPSDTNGGGPYDDDDVSDEFYWAAAELYLTTKEGEYLEALKTSAHLAKDAAGDQTAMDWKKVGMLGTISLATVPGADASTVEQAKAAIVATADAYLANLEGEGYMTPLPSMESNTYPWGSNSWVLNNGIILALAHQFTGDDRYREAVVGAMDYVLGRNAMTQSYVTGYGTKPLQNPHHRFWAHQLDPKSPPPPPGIVSGGPNSALQDPYAQKVGLPGCAPQKCFVDHIESWSTNEITINWNAPLTWVVDYLDHTAA